MVNKETLLTNLGCTTCKSDTPNLANHLFFPIKPFLHLALKYVSSHALFHSILLKSLVIQTEDSKFTYLSVAKRQDQPLSFVVPVVVARQ